MAREDAREHVGVGFPERDVRTASGGVLDAGADRTAVYEHRRQVGGAHPVGVGGDVGHALFDPPCRAAQPVVLQRHVERRHDNVGHVVRRVGAGLEARGLELRDHRGRSQQKEPAGGGVAGLDVVDRGQRRGVHLVARGFDAQLGEFEQVVVDALRGGVRQERVADALFAESAQESLRVREERHAHVDRAVHVERHVADAAQALHQFAVLPDGAVFVKVFHCRYFLSMRCRSMTAPEVSITFRSMPFGSADTRRQSLFELTRIGKSTPRLPSSIHW